MIRTSVVRSTFILGSGSWVGVQVGEIEAEEGCLFAEFEKGDVVAAVDGGDGDRGGVADLGEVEGVGLGLAAPGGMLAAGTVEQGKAQGLGELVEVCFVWSHGSGVTSEEKEIDGAGVFWCDAGMDDFGEMVDYAEALARKWSAVTLDEMRKRAEMEDTGRVSESIANPDGSSIYVVTCITGEEQLRFFLGQFRIAPEPEKDWLKTTLMDLLAENLQGGQPLTVEQLASSAGSPLAVIVVATNPLAIRVSSVIVFGSKVS